jgi:MFS family permease
LGTQPAGQAQGAAGGPQYDRSRLFITSCVSLLTTSMVFSIRGDVEGQMSQVFHLTKEQMGAIWSPAFWAFTIAIFISGAVIDMLGMRTLHALSSLGYIVGLLLVIFAPHPSGPVASIFGDTGTVVLFIGFMIMGLSQGLVEGVINPLIASLYTDNKTQQLNRLHAWWPGGLVIGGLLAYGLTQAGANWQIKLGCIMVPAVIYLFMVLSQPYPQTERVVSNVSTGDMWREATRPLFLLLFVCMWMTAATELGPDQWFPSLMKSLTGLEGILFLVYTAGLMFILRTFAGPIIHKISPAGMLIMCSVVSAIGLFWLGSLHAGTSTLVAFAAATVFGFGKTFFWPTMLGVTAEQFPRGGALLISLMGGAGMLSVAVALPIMGDIFDKLGPGPALQRVGYLPIILTVIFSALFFYFQSKGGYKPVRLATEEPIATGEL